MTAHDPQMLKGVLSILLLQLLAERESYGWEIVQRLRAEGLTDLMEGTVYPAMARLEREGRVSARLIPSSSGPAAQVLPADPGGVRRAGRRQAGLGRASKGRQHNHRASPAPRGPGDGTGRGQWGITCRELTRRMPLP